MTDTTDADLPIAAFAQHLRADAKDREALLALIGDGGNATVIADFANRRGYRVSSDEVTALFAAVAGTDGELADEELAGMAGGLSVGDFFKKIGSILDGIAKSAPSYPRP